MSNDTILFLHNIHWGFRFLYLLKLFLYKVFSWKYDRKPCKLKEKLQAGWTGLEEERFQIAQKKQLRRGD